MKVEKGEFLLCKKNCKNFLDVIVFEIGKSYKVYSISYKNNKTAYNIDSGDNIYNFENDSLDACFYTKSEARYIKLKNLQDKT